MRFRERIAGGVTGTSSMLNEPARIMPTSREGRPLLASAYLLASSSRGTSYNARCCAHIVTNRAFRLLEVAGRNSDSLHNSFAADGRDAPFFIKVVCLIC